MNSLQAARVLLVRAVEESQPDSLPGEALVQAVVEAGPLEDEAAWLARRAEYLTEHCLAPYRPLLAMTDALTPSLGVTCLPPLFAGLATNYLGPAEKIHVLYNPIVLLVAWNLCVYAFFAGRAIGFRASSRARPPGPLASWALRRVLPAAWVRFHKITADAGQGVKSVAQVARAFWSRWALVGGPLFAGSVRRLLHVAAIAIAVGAIFGMYVRGFFFEYDVVWRSTFLRDPETIARVLGIVLGPASILTGNPLPDTRTVLPMLAPEGVGAAHWIWLYTVSALLFILVPRALLLIAGSFRLRSLRGEVRLDLGDAYYRDVVGRAKQVQLDRIAGAITTDVRIEIGRFAEGVAIFVGGRLYDARIVPKLRGFRERGGRIEDLEVEIARECESFQAELDDHLVEARREFESSLGRAVARTIGAQVSIDAARPTGALGEGVGGAAHAATDGPRLIGQDVGLVVGSAVSGAIALVTATISGGFGHSIGAAALVSLLHTTGPVGFLIGAVVGFAAAGGAFYLGRDKAAAALKRVRLPAWVAKVILRARRLQRLVDEGRSRCQASVRERIESELEPMTPDIADQVWRKLRPLLAEQYRPTSAS